MNIIRDISNPIGAISDILNEIIDDIDNPSITEKAISGKLDQIDFIIKTLYNPNQTGTLPEEFKTSRLSDNPDIDHISDGIYNNRVVDTIDNIDKKIKNSRMENKKYFNKRLNNIKNK